MPTATRADLSTPALLVDLDAFEANLATLAAHCRGSGCHFRPHAKTHKCPEVARRQIASGARGISTATVAEAEAMVGAGLPGVLLTSPIMDRGKVARMVELARSGGDVLLAVGHAREVDLLAELATAAGVTMDVLVDLDVGDGRFGIAPGPLAVDLARRIGRHEALRIRGVQAYLGSAAHVAGFAARERFSLEALGRAVATRDELAALGFDAAFLSCASTGTYNIDSQLPGEIELQCGSYVFMDVEYREIGGRRDPDHYTDFRPSLTVLATVVGDAHAHAGFVTVDAGIKAFAADSPARPEPQGWPGLTYEFHGDEFGRLVAQPGASLPRAGDRVEFHPPHCDPTVNLYDRIHALRGDVVEEVWEIMARREQVGATGRA